MKMTSRQLGDTVACNLTDLESKDVSVSFFFAWAFSAA